MKAIELEMMESSIRENVAKQFNIEQHHIDSIELNANYKDIVRESKNVQYYINEADYDQHDDEGKPWENGNPDYNEECDKRQHLYEMIYNMYYDEADSYVQYVREERVKDVELELGQLSNLIEQMVEVDLKDNNLENFYGWTEDYEQVLDNYTQSLSDYSKNIEGLCNVVNDATDMIINGIYNYLQGK